MKYEIQHANQGAGAIVNNSSTNGLVAWDLSLCCQQTCSDGADAIGCSRLCQTGHSDQCRQSGPIATDLMARSADQMGITFDDLGSMVPMGRIGQATEVGLCFSALMLLATSRDNP